MFLLKPPRKFALAIILVFSLLVLISCPSDIFQVQIAALPEINPQSGNYDSPLRLTMTTTEEGGVICYTTNGYDPSFSGTFYTGPITVSSSMTVKAITMKEGYKNSAVAERTYSIQEYRITFDENGGSVPTPQNINVKNGESYGTLAVSSRTGYDFEGWWTALDGSGIEVSSNTIVDLNSNQTLYAKWRPKSYVILFDASGGSSTDPISKAIVFQEPYGTLPQTTKTGYVFGGWWTGKNAFGVEITADTKVTKADNHTLYAKWTPGQYRVDLNAQGGKLTQSFLSVTYNGTYGNLPVPAKTGYDFGGWWTAPNGTGTTITSTSKVTLASDHTLYAKWTPKTYTITFNAALGTYTGEETMSVTYGQTYGALPVPTRDHHIFKGWRTEANGGGTLIVESSIFSGTSDKTIYADWEFEVFTGPAGGLVFYENSNWVQDGWRYLEAAPFGWSVDSGGIILDPYFEWGAYGDSWVIESTNTSIGSGESNTLNIVSYHYNLLISYADNPTYYHEDNDGSIAARVCYVWGAVQGETAYTDWFLPSKDELNLMYERLAAKGKGGFTPLHYFSSSEDGNEAWAQLFLDGTQFLARKSSSVSVRPVRAYTYGND